MRPILCVVDFSHPSQKVLEVAVSLALKNKASLIVLYAYRLINDSALDVQHLKNRLEVEAYQKFSLLEAEVLQSVPKLRYEFYPEIGFVTDRILFHVYKNNIDTIVISDLSTIAQDNRKSSLKELFANNSLHLVTVPETEATQVESR